MYTYEYECIGVKTGFTRVKTLDYREIIDRRAKNGWRYVGFIPSVQAGHGFITEMDLVLKRGCKSGL